jgi:uncharacterized SAM-dependent methyltransferase
MSRKLILFLGSSIGNFSRSEAAAFLRDVRATMRQGDRLLVGIDLRKDRRTLKCAYDDESGTTARFNKNVLTRLNHEFDANFDIDAFEHAAVVNHDVGRVEMHLVSRRKQTVNVGALGMTVDFRDGESIHTENSYKYSAEEISNLAESADLMATHCWYDAASRFSVNLLAPRC